MSLVDHSRRFSIEAGVTDWISLNRYVAQLAVVEGAISTWQWTASDWFSFARIGYRADRSEAGDTLLHDRATLLRQGAADRVHDVYHRRGVDSLRTIRETFDRDDTTEELCATVVAARGASNPDTPTLN